MTEDKSPHQNIDPTLHTVSWGKTRDGMTFAVSKGTAYPFESTVTRGEHVLVLAPIGRGMTEGFRLLDIYDEAAPLLSMVELQNALSLKDDEDPNV